MTHFHIVSATGARPTLQWIERELGDVWRHLHGGRISERAEQRDARPATELCGEVAEFGGMLGEDEDWDADA